jgi:hypothetical protein
METIHRIDFFYYVNKVWKKQIHLELRDQWFYAGTDSDYEENDILLQALAQRSQRYTSSIGDPLKFFDWFYEKGMGLFIEYFTNIPQIRFGLNSITIRNRTKFLHEILVERSNESRKTLRIEFASELQNLFNYQQSIISKILRDQYNNTSDITSLHTYLLNIQERLVNFRPRAIPPDIYIDVFNNAFESVKQSILEVIGELLLKSGYRDVDDNVNILSPKEKQNLLNEIYSMDIGANSFIADSPNSQTDFVQFFSKPGNREKKVEFFIECKSNEAAIILDKMKGLGFNIIYEELDQNKTFKTSPTSHLTAQYISKAISISKKKQSPKTLNEINSFFHDLESRYFYNKR